MNRGVKSDKFFASYSPYVLAVYSLWAVGFTVVVWGFNGGHIAPVVYLAMIGRVVISATLTGLRAKSETGVEAAGWWMITVGSVFAALAIVARYPTNTEPADSVSVMVISGIACAVFVMMVWDKISAISRVRVVVDSLWISAAVTVSLLFVLVLPIATSARTGLVDNVAIFTQIVLLSLATALLVNLYFQNKGKALLGPGLVHMGFVFLSSLAILDTLRAFDLIGYDRFVEFAAFFTDYPFVFASQLARPKKRSSTIETAKGAHVSALTTVPLGVGILVLSWTAPEEYRIPVILGGVLCVVLAMRITAVGAENSKLEAELFDIATTDDLTKLPNRRALDIDFDLIDDSSSVTALYIDLDFFKEVNDSHGHEGGDELLIQFAQRLSETVRKEDKCYRVGGDEFVVLLGLLSDEENEQRNPWDINAFVHRVVQVCEEPFSLSMGTVSVGMTVGVATSGTEAELVSNADRAMVQSKREGRGGVAFHKVAATS